VKRSVSRMPYASEGETGNMNEWIITIIRLGSSWLEESGRAQLVGTIRASPWRKRGKPREASARIAHLLIKTEPATSWVQISQSRLSARARMRRRELIFIVTWVHIRRSIYVSVYLSIYLSIYPSIYSSTSLVNLARFFFQFLNLYTVGRTLWTGDQPVSRPLPTHRTTQIENKRTQTFMPRVGFESMIPVSERAKTVHGLDRAATVIGT
jgi:hypothetical protein